MPKKVYRCTFYGAHLHPQIRTETVRDDADLVSLVRHYDPADPAYRRRSGPLDPWRDNPIGPQPVFRVLVPTTEAKRPDAGERAMDQLIAWLKERG